MLKKGIVTDGEKWRERAVAIRAFERLSDHQLADIGIPRAQIREVVDVRFQAGASITANFAFGSNCDLQRRLALRLKCDGEATLSVGRRLGAWRGCFCGAAMARAGQAASLSTRARSNSRLRWFSGIA